MARTNSWYEVDRAGLATIAKRRGMAFIITEPIQNAWDEAGVTRVDVDLLAVAGKPHVRLIVRDDAPDGFRDLADSYSLFRESYKVGNPEQRGRFNVGEKLLLSVAVEATVSSTTGTVRFGPNGRRRSSAKTERGSVLDATLRMTRAELDEAIEFAGLLIPPSGIETYVNGVRLAAREPIRVARRCLETETRGEDGGFHYCYRTCDVRFYEPAADEEPHVYEMGIPIDKIACPWHVEVSQKVPLSLDRSSIRAGFTRALITEAAEAMASEMDADDARGAWVADALERMTDDDAVRAVVKKRFGKAVVYDPSDPEASKRALDAGYTVVRGTELSKSAWGVVRRSGALEAAGKRFSTRQPTSIDGEPPVPVDEWTRAMHRFARYARLFSMYALDCDEPLTVNFYRLPGSRALAFCGGGELGVNLSNGGAGLLDRMDPEEVNRLLIHEVAHVRAKDHLSDAFHEECCRIGARMMRGFYESL